MSEATEVRSLTEALIEANDLLIGLYDLVDVTSQSFDEAEVVNDILERSLRIVHADALELITPTDRIMVGSPPTLRRATDRVERAKATSVTATHGLGLTGELRATRPDLEFSTGDRKLLSAVLRTTLAAIETARLHTEGIQQALDARETERAAQVAQLAMPVSRPDVDDVDIFFKNQQARNTGGDLFCFHENGDRLAFAVGDVSGKGLSAAVMMTTAVCATTAAFRDDRADTPGSQLCSVNDWMYEHLSEAGSFISMFIGHYRRNTNELRWANAGHSPCLLSTEHTTMDLPALTPPLGVFPQMMNRSSVSPLADNDIVLIGSDGLVEQPNTAGEAFGEQRLHDVLRTERGESAASIGSTLLQAVTAFAGELPQSDDRTAVLLRHRIGDAS